MCMTWGISPRLLIHLLWKCLWRRGSEIEILMTLKSLEDGKVTFLKAAEMAGMNVWDFANILREESIVWIKSQRLIRQDLDDALR
ncbi:MAG: hypothetical protein FIB07_01215 [Candidatus Methanoperedens sp.]|nr:hypothetical protein [Candidatus Methanoperedens sp.]